VQRARKWTRRHQAMVTTATAGLLVVLTVLGAGLGWLVRDRAGRREKAAEALLEADRLRQEEKWAESHSALRRAAEVLAGVVAAEDLREQTRNLAKDVEMARRLEDIRLEVVPGREDWDFDAADRAYGEAFPGYGLDVENLDLPEAVERIRARA